jgi:hypothetical protein
MAYLSVAQVRALPNLSDTAKFTDAEITAAVTWFETLFEDYTGVAWEVRSVTGERHWDPGGLLILDHLKPVTISALRTYTDAATSVAYTAAELAALRFEPSGVVLRHPLSRFTSSTYGLVAVDYTHGYTAPPADVVEAAKIAVRDHLIVDYQANRQYAVSTEIGIVRTSTPDAAAGRPFGIPEVDAVANRRNHSVPSVSVV